MKTKTIKIWAATKNNTLELHPVRRAASGCIEAYDIIAYTVHASVDLEQLSPAAQFIAERIKTTLRCGKNVRCYSRKTEVELLREAGHGEDYIRRVQKCYGPLPQPYMDYDFGIYRHDVTPEVFLNSAAKDIGLQSTHMRIDDDVFKF